MLAGHIRLGYRPLFHREDRLAGLAVEEEEKAHLGGLATAGMSRPSFRTVIRLGWAGRS